jgi:hypothetical protein
VDPDRRGPPPDPAGPDRVRVLIMRCRLSPGAEAGEVFASKEKRRILGALIAPVNLGRPPGGDIVEGAPTRPGPGFPGEERWEFLLRQLAARRSPSSAPAPAALVPGRARDARLVLVKAPIYRTRRDPDFAREILGRLVGSETFRDHLEKSGIGGPVVAVAFPRPGPNWYREHHGKPEISLFVVLARLASEDASLDDLFEPPGRDLLGAFTAEMDFGIGGAEDSVGEIAAIGPIRDLEERWTFFLSGL